MLVWVGRLESNDENGASAVEYGLLVAGIAAIIITVVFLFGGAVTDMFNNTCDSVGAGSNGSMYCDS